MSALRLRGRPTLTWLIFYFGRVYCGLIVYAFTNATRSNQSQYMLLCTDTHTRSVYALDRCSRHINRTVLAVIHLDFFHAEKYFHLPVFFSLSSFFDIFFFFIFLCRRRLRCLHLFFAVVAVIVVLFLWQLQFSFVVSCSRQIFPVEKKTSLRPRFDYAISPFAQVTRKRQIFEFHNFFLLFFSFVSFSLSRFSADVNINVDDDNFFLFVTFFRGFANGFNQAIEL